MIQMSECRSRFLSAVIGQLVVRRFEFMKPHTAVFNVGVYLAHTLPVAFLEPDFFHFELLDARSGLHCTTDGSHIFRQRVKFFRPVAPNNRIERTGVGRFFLFHKVFGYWLSRVAGRSCGALGDSAIVSLTEWWMFFALDKSVVIFALSVHFFGSLLRFHQSVIGAFSGIVNAVLESSYPQLKFVIHRLHIA